MGEIVVPNSNDVIGFMGKIGKPILPEQVKQVYTVFYPDRRVFRYSDKGKDRVIKARPNSPESQIEVRNMTLLEGSYRYSGGHFDHTRSEVLASGYMLIDMPWLGHNLIELANELDLRDEGYEPLITNFKGFSTDHIFELIDRLRKDHLLFAKQHGIIHRDILQMKKPNNVVYNPLIDRLLLIDAEALPLYSEDKEVDFLEALEDVEDWIYLNLKKE